MSVPLSTHTPPLHAPNQSLREAQLLQWIEHAAHLLPSQGPITVFVHHNTLHSFEDLPFEQALRIGSRAYRCQTYLPEDRYREELRRGRIQVEDLTAELVEDLGDEADRLLGFLGTRAALRLSMLEHPVRVAPDAELRWLVAETDALRRFRPEVPRVVRDRIIRETRRWVLRDLPRAWGAPVPDTTHRLWPVLTHLLQSEGMESLESWSEAQWEAFVLHLLWRVCHRGVHGLPRRHDQDPPPLRHRDWLLLATGADSDQLVHDLLIRFCGAFLDQGVASWTLPDREHGFWTAFCRLYEPPGGPPDRWLRPLSAELRRQRAAQLTPLGSIAESLSLLGVAGPEEESFLTETLLALGGWAGMLWQMETNAEWTIRPAPRGTLVEYLAVRLILERLALAHLARETLGWSDSVQELRPVLRARVPHSPAASVDQRAYLVFQLAQLRGWSPEDLARLSRAEWGRLVEELESFSQWERRRIFHRAYERRYRIEALDALACHNGSAPPPRPAPKFQVVTCIDDREESFRRHLEEIEPACETFGAAGFFATVMYYRGAADAHFIPLCPIVVKPQHYVREEVASEQADNHARRAQTRRLLGTASHWFHTGSRSFLAGVFTSLVGSLASFPLVMRILFPRLTARLRRLGSRFVQPPAATQLRIERSAPNPGPLEEQLGFSLEEMTANVARQLQDIGLTRGFARLVILIGHGSSSLNNPHESAYNCGACGGGRGGPNARAFSQMANDPRVRRRLAAQGLDLPPDAVFIGAYHNTCDDSLTWFDLDRLPESHRGDFEAARRVFDEARERNAHERCRRFESAPLSLTPAEALRHVEERAEDLSQARPEYNHATNALSVVGRRDRTRGLFLDRRAFLTSYDPTQDDAEHTILARILAAVIPVCAGISLEYYFSCVDVAVLGCGSKLPHNIAALLGVMEGAASDLRPGLSYQMIEIHEPLRLLFVIETTPAAMLAIMDRNPTIGRLVRNGWVQLATLDPDGPTIHLFQSGEFQPYRPQSDRLPVVSCSGDWYRGWRDHLGFARILTDVASAPLSAEPLWEGRS